MHTNRHVFLLGLVSAIVLSLPTYAQVRASLRAELVEQNLGKKAVSVRVHVRGVALMDPTRDSEPWAAHLHYVLDDGIPVATASARMSFHGLASGRHTLVVRLMSHQEEPLAEDKRFEITMP